MFGLPPLQNWPAAADQAAAERLIERVSEGVDVARLEVAALVRAIGGNSPFLSDLAVRESAALARLIADGPDAAVADMLAQLRSVAPGARPEEVSAAMRRAKRAVALTAAFADIGGIWPLERFTEVMTELAEASLQLAVGHLLIAAQAAGHVRLADPEHPAERSGFAVLGMGKLGAGELNYSSDIDLILIYDPAAPIYTPRTQGDELRRFTSRLARGLVTLMERRDAEGYVFRTDLRLRPDPAVTPPAVSLPAALTYYESMGQNWERAAMIKARPVAGDLRTGAEFLEAIRPFVWRRGLDFAAVTDIAALKRRIDAHRGVAEGLAGFNVKLGRGGIREIEFLAQTLQMVWGGRDPRLRDRTTLGALAVLSETGHLPRDAAHELAGAYRLLRRVEHRLQMVADRQVHALPEQGAELGRFAVFMGFPGVAELRATLLGHLGRVRERYAMVFEAIPTEQVDVPFAGDLDFRGDDPAPAGTVDALKELGFGDSGRIIATVRGWQAGRIRAFRSERARGSLERVLPVLLAALGRQAQPDAVFARFDTFLSRLPSGVQLLSLFERNPALLERLAALLGAAPFLADHLTIHPASLEGLLSQDDAPADPAVLMARRLRDARLLEEAIAIVRRTVREEDFAISAATLEGRLDADEAGLRRTALADAALSSLLEPVEVDFARRYGLVHGGRMAVVVLGKAGGREMMAGSDLDLMLIYDYPASATESGGARSLPAPQYFLRLVHAYVAALTSPGADGQLYAVDMRLRPSGNKGPVAVSLAAFRRYHAEAAWTWERMALTRARVVAGEEAFRREVEEAIREAVAAPVPAEQVRADAAAMRARMVRDLPPSGPWDVKLRVGGQVDVEFIAQVLQLMHARADSGVCDTTTRSALRRLAEVGYLDAGDAEMLVGADRLWRTIQGMLRIAVGRSVPRELTEAVVWPLLRATGLADAAGLRRTVERTAGVVRAAFARILGEVG
jgi:[glutamine synthetase] adenylyltransferase / [glutamine synthetase]-adenylyl-L-tyrosine phosphorylase